MRRRLRGSAGVAASLALTLVFLATVAGLPLLAPDPGSALYEADVLMEVTELILLEVLRAAPALLAEISATRARAPLGGADPLVVLGVGLDTEHWGFDFKTTPLERVRGLADTIILGTFSRATSRLVLVSIPRDTIVSVPGVGQARINATFARGGLPLLAETVERLLEVPVHRYVIVNFEGFEAFIDYIGGIEVEVREPLRGPRGVWLRPGRHRLDGRQALRYVRHRYGTQRQDLDRVERQREFLLGLVQALQRDGLIQALKFAVRRADLYKTDLTPMELLVLYPHVRRLNVAEVEHYTLPGTLVQNEYWRLDRARWEALRKRLLTPGP